MLFVQEIEVSIGKPTRTPILLGHNLAGSGRKFRTDLATEGSLDEQGVRKQHVGAQAAEGDHDRAVRERKLPFPTNLDGHIVAKLGAQLDRKSVV